MPDSFDTVDGSEMSYYELHRKFADSHHGVHLGQQIRYGRFKPEIISNEEWSQAPLGADVNNLSHMPLTKGLAREYLKNQDKQKALNRTDSQMLLLASIVHDWAEAISDDKMFDQKTASEDDQEASIMLFLLKGTLGARLTKDQLMEVYSIVKDKQSRLGEVFNAIERVGYLRTGLNAWVASKKPAGEVKGGVSGKEEIQLRAAFQWLASNVAGNQVRALLSHAEKYHPIAVYMGNSRSRIENLFKEMPAGIFENYPTKDNEGKNEQLIQFQKFMEAKTAWDKSSFAKTKAA